MAGLRVSTAPDAGGDARTEVPADRGRRGSLLFLLAVATLCLLPLRHLEPEIEELERWRQMDAASNVLGFADGPLDPLHPPVAWMGWHRTVVLECPLPQLAAAIVLRVADSRDLRIVRVVFWVFFLGAVTYYFLLARRLAGEPAARWATALLLSSPLVVLYSRAIHVDVATLGLAFGMTYHYVRGLRDSEPRHLLLGSVLAVPAWLIKAPYVWIFGPLLLREAWRARSGGILRRALPHVAAGPAAFVLWRLHAERTNAAAPDWSFLPGWFRFVDLGDWYFGTLADRFSERWWSLLGERVPVDAIGAGTIAVALVALAAGAGREVPGRREAGLWLAFAVLNALVFFRLTAIHRYYLLPLVAPFALLGGTLVAGALARARAPRRRRVLAALFACLAAAGAVAAHVVAEARYYRGQGNLARTMRPLRTGSPPTDLVITAAPWLSFAAPLMLFPARRSGWSVPSAELDARVLDRLRCEGASWLAYLESTPPAGELAARLAAAPVVEERAGRRNRLWVYDLRPLGAPAGCRQPARAR